MPPTMPTVPALLDAWLPACDGLDCVSPIAAPAALRIAVSSAATPIADEPAEEGRAPVDPAELLALAGVHVPRRAGAPLPRVRRAARVAPRSCVRAIS